MDRTRCPQDKDYRLGFELAPSLTQQRSTLPPPLPPTLVHDFEVVGVANTTLASAEKAAAACQVPRAFSSAAKLAASPDVDVVTVTVRVPRPLEVVRTALSAGKHVYCEWPLGNGLAEAEEIAALAQRHGALDIVGCQARVAPEIMHLRRLIEAGFLGEVLSSSLTATGGRWRASIPRRPKAHIGGCAHRGSRAVPTGPAPYDRRRLAGRRHGWQRGPGVCPLGERSERWQPHGPGLRGRGSTA